MLIFYLFQKRIVYLSLLVLVIFFYFFNMLLFLSIILGITFFLFRKKKYLLKSDYSAGLYSPVSGIVKNIEEITKKNRFGEELKVVHIMVPHFFSMGFLSGMGSEVEEVTYNKGPRYLRYSPVEIDYTRELNDFYFQSTLIKFKQSVENTFALQFIACDLGLSLDLWCLPGDITRRGSMLGVFPFGGTVLVYLPKKYTILVKKGQWIDPQRTMIASST